MFCRFLLGLLMNIFEESKRKILIVAHRGTAAGNIPCNTIPAYELAVRQGADMIEIDVEACADGELFIFHPQMEKHHLGFDGSITKLSGAEVRNLRYLNYDRTQTQFGLETLSEVLERFKGRCFINVDKFWGHPVEIYNEIKRHNMVDQVLVKSAPSDKVFSVLKEVAPDVAFMPVVRSEHPMHGELMKSGINYVGAEVLFSSDTQPVASPEFIEMMHRDGKIVWANSIIYNYKEQLTGGHSDDAAICGDRDYGWGWLAKRGFDLIQTDWTSELISYLKENNLLYR